VPTDLDDLITSPFPLQPHERALLQERPSVRLVVGETMRILWVFAVTVGLSLLVERFGPPDPYAQAPPVPAFGLGVLGIELVYLTPGLVRAFIHVFCTQYVLTTERVYARTEFVSTDLKVVPYEKISQIRLRRGLFGWLLGITEVRVHAYSSHEGNVRLRGLRHPLPAFQTLREQIRIHNTAESVVRSD
jgi:uncharacterized membrane protein YdbT with pleckstrin-like domain